MDFGLSDKVALVLGGGGGLGSAVSTTLAAEGVRVAVADISDDGLKRVATELESASRQFMTLNWDLEDLSRIAPNIENIENELGSVDVLVNITGGPPPTPVTGQDPELWSKQFRSMILSVIAITDRVLPKMREKKWGRIITSTSSGVLEPIPNLGLSNSLRSTLVTWSKTLAGEVGGDGITANIVVPGRIDTGRIRFLDQARADREVRSVEEVMETSTQTIPLGRYGRPQEYADTIAFLASRSASYITGSVIRVDGGMLAST
jgi:3-oxoacyl-[acyl-carrier protein] reductase